MRAVNTELAARLARVERLVSRNSANSSMPPSKDGEPGRTVPDEPVKKRPADGEGRKRGKQRGAAGANLAWRADPDARVHRFPEGCCECGAELGEAADLGVSDRFQQTEIPLVSATTTQNTSGRLTSEARTRDRYRIRGVISTATKHGLDQLKVIRDALTGRAWIPPLPVPT